MATPWDTALAAINYIGTHASADLSPGGGTVKQTCRGCIELSSTITPANSTIAGWFCYSEGVVVSLPTLFYCGIMETLFSDGLWVYISTGTVTAATHITYRYGSTLAAALPSTVDFSSWQHLAFTNSGGTVTGYLNGTSFSVGTLANPQYKSIGVDTESSRKTGMIAAGVGLWDSVLSGADLAWLANSANRPDPTAGGGGTTTYHPLKSRALGPR